MKQLVPILVTIVGILLILPMLGVDALGNLGTGVTGWAVPIIVLVIGIMGLIKKQ